MIEMLRHQTVTLDLFREWMDVPDDLEADGRFELVENVGYARALHEAGATLHQDAAGRLFVRVDTLQPI